MPSPNPMMLLRAGAAALLALVTFAVLVPVTTASTYGALSLGKAGVQSYDGWSVNSQLSGGYGDANLGPTGAVSLWNINNGRSQFVPGESASFRLTAPPNTTIRGVDWSHRISGLAGGDWNFVVRDSSQARIYWDVPAQNRDVPVSVGASGTYVDFQLQCGGPNVCWAHDGTAQSITNAVLWLDDAQPPSAGAPSGELVGDAKLIGGADLSYHASDAGAGVEYTVFYADARPISWQTIDTNSGHCKDRGGITYDRRVPCPLSATATATLDTTTLADGNHTLKATVMDASGNETQVLAPITKLVANHPPVNTRVPAMFASDASAVAFASPRPGLTITFPDAGTWTGPSLTTSVAWLRCDRSGAACEQIPGATTLSYTPTADDVGHTLKLASTATNVADTVTVYSAKSGEVTSPKGAGDLVDKPQQDKPAPQTGTGEVVPPPTIVVPTLPPAAVSSTTNNTHTVIGRVVGSPAGTACPGERASLRFQHVSGGKVKLGYGKAGTAQLELTCTTTGKAIAEAKLEIATKTGSKPAVASDVVTDGAGHAIIRLGKGASRGVTVGYRMFSDDALARATATLKVQVNGRVGITASRKHLRNGQAVTLRGSLAGGLVPSRGVQLAVQWKDGGRWRPFAQIKTNKKGQYTYAYRFIRSKRTVVYRLRVQIMGGQVDYPYGAVSSKSVKVTVGR